MDWNSITKGFDWNFEPLPPGDYELRVADVRPRWTSTGRTNIALVYEVLTGPHAGRRIMENRVLAPENPEALRIFFQTMHALGLDQEFFAKNPDLDTLHAALVGQRVMGGVGVETYRETPRNTVGWLRPLPADAPKPSRRRKSA